MYMCGVCGMSIVCVYVCGVSAVWECDVVCAYVWYVCMWCVCVCVVDV